MTKLIYKLITELEMYNIHFSNTAALEIVFKKLLKEA